MKIYKTQKEVEKDIKDGVLAIKGDVKFECSILIEAKIIITAGNINAGDITAWDINARNINAGNINAGDINARNLILAKLFHAFMRATDDFPPHSHSNLALADADKLDFDFAVLVIHAQHAEKNTQLILPEYFKRDA